jgi:hypothetical protein
MDLSNPEVVLTITGIILNVLGILETIYRSRKDNK